ncbi:hypothetical protein F4861DRAFT_451194 [Xylaria intraflava]|nr:hypothetical protein F4861DRAFT_451194 [Xylaria intraflava]
MSTSKRRKLNADDSPQPMSAFALRKKLLAQQSPLPSPSLGPADVSGTPSDNSTSQGVSGSPKKARTPRSSRRILVESRETPNSYQSGESQPAEASTGLLDPLMSGTGDGPNNFSPFSLEEGQERHDTYDASGPSQSVNFTSFRPSKGNFRKKKDNVLQLKLEEGERLVIFGSYGVRVESGEVTVYGATLGASKDVFWIHAPQSHALPVIRCTDDANVELHPHPGARELKELGRLSPLFRKLWWEDPSLPSQDKSALSGETFRILYTSEDGPRRAVIQDLKLPPEWNREIAVHVDMQDSGPSSIMITGPKSSGKSTFGKVLTNRLLTSTHNGRKKSGHAGVVVLDLDPGQPEYCGPGQIALILITKPVLSPAFCRPVDASGIRTIRSHALAALSPASDPELYTEMALDLIAHYRNAFGSYPLVVNTPGWIQGTGLDLLVSLIGELRPSKVIYMSQSGPADAVEALEGACNAILSTLPPQPNQNSLRTAVDLRSMQTMAYFHAEPTTGQNSGSQFHLFQKPLTAMAPWQVRFRGDGAGISAVLFYGFPTQAGLVADAINGTILAAVEVESPDAFRQIAGIQSRPGNTADDAPPGSPMDLDANAEDLPKLTSFSLFREKLMTQTAEGIPFIDTSQGLTLDPRYSRCLGLVLVRGIDVENGNFHLLSPITTTQVDDVKASGGQIVLVSGKFDPPSWAYTEDLYLQSQGDDGDGNDGLDSNQEEDIGDNSDDAKGDNTAFAQNSAGPVPWIEILARNQKRGAGSKAWRVRRDLGRAGGD